METQRLFIAINFPLEIKKSIGEIQRDLKAQFKNVKWVEEKNFHLTLKFLGEVSTNAIDEIKEALIRSTADTEPFNITLRNLGAFPKPKEAKVIWLGVDEGTNKIVDLFKSIDLELWKVGFKREVKVYKPHLTLGRCRETQDIELYKFSREFRSKIESLDLMMSELTPKGPIYTLLESLEFNV